MKKFSLSFNFVTVLFLSFNTPSISQSISDWKTLASQRIDSVRRSELVIRVIDVQGNPVSNVSVKIELVNHQFSFGGVISGKLLLGENEILLKKVFLENFNKAGFNNDLKYKHKDKLAINADILIPWFTENEIPVRGHTLIWPGWWHMHSGFQKFKNSNDTTGLRAACRKQIVEYAKKWEVVEWDVLNEPYKNHDIQDLLGKDVFIEWFRLARNNTDARLFLNDYQIITAPVNAQSYTKAKWSNYESHVKILNSFCLIDGLGVQSRRSYDIPVDTLYDRLSRLSRFGLPILATEFEISDKRNRYDLASADRLRIFRETMYTYFSHPGVEGIMYWTVFGNGDNALFDFAGCPTDLGNEWINLVKKKWNTDVVKFADQYGTVKERAFHGCYKIQITDGTKLINYDLEHVSESDFTLVF